LAFSDGTLPVEHAAEQVRYKLHLPLALKPRQSERLSRDTCHQGVSVSLDDVMTFQPRFVGKCDLVVTDHRQPGKLRCPRYAGGGRKALIWQKSTPAASSSAIIRRPVTVVGIGKLDAVGELAGPLRDA
jgi:hypothetical protein